VAAALIGCFALWSLGKVFTQSVLTTEPVALMASKIYSLGLIFFPAFSVWLVAIILERKKLLASPAFYFALFIPPVLLWPMFCANMLITAPVLTPFGWYGSWKNGIWSYAFFAYYAGFCLIFMYMYITYLTQKKNRNTVEYKQAAVLFGGTLVSFAVAEIMMRLLPKILGTPALYGDMANIYVILFVAALIYTIARHRMFSFTPAYAAENIITEMSESLILLNGDMEIQYVNRAAAEMFACSAEELTGQSISRLIPHRSFANYIIKKIITEEKIRGLETAFFSTGCNHSIPVLFSASVIKEHGNIIGVICLMRDISDRKKAVEQIKMERDMAQLYLDIAGIMFIVLNTEGEVTLINKKVNSTLGYSDSEILGKKWHVNFVAEADMAMAIKVFSSLIDGSGNGSSNVETCVVTKSGSTRLIKWTNITLKDAKGAITGTLSSGEDITEQREAENELKDSYEKLKELDVLKSNFLSMVSHELRTPLTSIKGFVAFLMGGAAGPMNEQQREFIEIIRNNSDRLLNLINDILDISKMESGTFTITKESANIMRTVESSLRDISSIARKKNVSVITSNEFDSLVFEFDSYRISQALINLLNNSIKFSPEGSKIILSLTELNSTEAAALPGIEDTSKLKKDHKYLLVSIKDSGVGLTAEQGRRVFDRFYQVENINTRKAQGTGLGLNIVRNIIEAHDGIVWAYSEGPEKGSTFNFILPI
jgi:PAS domain S-box-containing protein